MRLHEFVDSGSLGNILRILQDKADQKGNTLSISFDALKKMANSDELAISTPDALIQWKNKFDPKGKIIKDISQDPSNPRSYTLIINTQNQAAEPDKSTAGSPAPSVDKMATQGLPDKLKP